MEWYVYCERYGNIEKWNIFHHGGFFDGCVEAYRKHGNDRAEFLERVRRELLYYFWAKCEWEIVAGCWPPREKEKKLKIDVYDQVMSNWHAFSRYIWANREKLGKDAA